LENLPKRPLCASYQPFSSRIGHCFCIHIHTRSEHCKFFQRRSFSACRLSRFDIHSPYFLHFLHVAMPRLLLSLRSLSLLVTISAVIIGIELWRRDFGPADVGWRLPIRKPLEFISRQNAHIEASLCSTSDGEFTLNVQADCHTRPLR
jgi:hypothetical protein